MEEQFLEDAMDDNIDWIADLGDVTFDNPSAPVVVADGPILPSASAPVGLPNLPNSADDDTVGTFFPGQGCAEMQIDDDEDDDDSTTINTPIFSTTNDENREAHPVSEAPRAEVLGEASAAGV
jgi:hypothetical protein